MVSILTRVEMFAVCLSGFGCASISAGPPSAAGGDHVPTVVVIGTIHKGHLLQKEYPIALLGGLFDAYKPDLVLVEIRPEPFRLEQYEDGPFEMTYVTLHARARGVAVEPIDWFLDAPAEETAIPEPLQRRMMAELQALGDATGWPTFEDANSVSASRKAMRGLNILARYTRNSEWNQRQAWFHHRALDAINRHGARRVMAFVGFQHRPELEAFLGGMGLSVRSPLTLRSRGTAISADTRADARVVEAWKRGVDRLRSRAATADHELKKKLSQKLRYFEVAIEKRGSCCAREQDLRVP